MTTVTIFFGIIAAAIGVCAIMYTWFTMTMRREKQAIEAATKFVKETVDYMFERAKKFDEDVINGD